jgi:hypothetical protein
MLDCKTFGNYFTLAPTLLLKTESGGTGMANLEQKTVL